MSAIRKKKPRTLSYNPLVGALHIKQGSDEVGYWLDVLAHDFGPAARCFRLSKIVAPEDGAPDHYDVCFEGEDARCECRGFLRHARCKHVDSLRCLLERGSI
jgi:hypothetical protein